MPKDSNSNALVQPRRVESARPSARDVAHNVRPRSNVNGSEESSSYGPLPNATEHRSSGAAAPCWPLRPSAMMEPRLTRPSSTWSRPGANLPPAAEHVGGARSAACKCLRRADADSIDKEIVITTLLYGQGWPPEALARPSRLRSPIPGLDHIGHLKYAAVSNQRLPGARRSPSDGLCVRLRRLVYRTPAAIGSPQATLESNRCTMPIALLIPAARLLGSRFRSTHGT